MGCGSSQPLVDEGHVDTPPAPSGLSEKSRTTFASSSSIGSGTSSYGGASCATPKTPVPRQATPTGKDGNGGGSRFGAGKLPQKQATDFEVPKYSHADIKAMTFGFANKIGIGGFGTVYKGKLLDAMAEGGEVDVAVKVLEATSHQGPEEFLTEMLTMGALRHPTILQLWGCCNDRCRALVYEYIPHGDVYNHLKKAARGKVSFPFEERLRVAVGSAEALCVIHEQGYIHRDFKSSNVLLKQGMTPVLADFGLVRTIENFESFVSTRVMGTPGYIDPLYFEEGHLSPMCDVFSFGVFLLELLCGLSVDDKRFVVFREFLGCQGGGLAEPEEMVEEEELVAQDLKGSVPQVALRAYIELVRKCVADDWEHRYTMQKVLSKLQRLQRLAVDGRAAA